MVGGLSNEILTNLIAFTLESGELDSDTTALLHDRPDQLPASTNERVVNFRRDRHLFSDNIHLGK